LKKLKFADIGLSASILKAVADMGFEETSPIQSEAIPPILAGYDIIGTAQTGTGKTAAFAIPAIENIDYESRSIQTIVMCPTRELVIQVTEEFRKLMKYFPEANITAIYGGQEIDRQFRALKKNPQIIVGTPGRLIDHINRGTVKLNNVKYVVLDEADEMLDMGFREDIELILKETPKERQTVMFSATMNDPIVKLMRKYQKNPIRIDVSHQKINAPQIKQIYFEIIEKAKPEALARIIEMYSIKLALVFCNTRSKVDELVEILKTRGYFAEGLHGEMGQRQRDKVMYGFRNGSVEILVATDVAGRGIDVNNVEAVVNYDLPQDDEDYVHRIGRTGRAGKTGTAFSFVTSKQMYHLKRIEKSNEIRVERHKIPTLDDLDESRINTLSTTIQDLLVKEHLAKYSHLVEKLMGDDYTAMDIASVLLKMTIDKKNDSFDSTLVFEDEFRHEVSHSRKRTPVKKFHNESRVKPKEKSQFKRYQKPTEFRKKKKRG